MTRPRLSARAVIAVAMWLALAGCASVDPREAAEPVQTLVRERLGKGVAVHVTEDDAATVERRVGELLAAPLTADAAVQLALLNHRGVQASLASLGVARAELVQAARLPNPGFGYARHRSEGIVATERSLHVDLARWLTLPLVRQLEQRRYAQTQAAVAADVIAHAAQTRRAWVQAVAAEESLRHWRRAHDATAAGAELARRMVAVGNFSRLEQAREQAFHAEAALNLARAEMRALALRERLTRLLGLWGAQAAYTLPERLPDLPDEPRAVEDLERRAIAERLDLQAVRALAEQTARNLGLTRATRFVNVLEFGVARETAPGEAPTRSWELSFELPLFDWGEARVARAEALYRQQLHRAAEAAINARSEVREAFAAYRGSWDLARHQRDEIVPIARRISEENLLRYNGMLIGVFELLADARAQIAAVQGAIEALRDFWLAEADLEMALVGRPTLPLATAPATAAAAGGGAAH